MKEPNPILVAFHGILKALSRFLKTCWVSLLIFSVVAVLLTLPFQSGELVIDLLQSPFNLGVFWVLMVCLSLVVSHYPDYLDIKRQERGAVKLVNDANVNVQWTMSPSWSWFGILTFDRTPKNYYFLLPKDEQRVYRYYKILKHALGVLFLSSFYFIIFRTYTEVIGCSWTGNGLGLCASILSIFIYLLMYKLGKKKPNQKRMLILLTVLINVGLVLFVVLLYSSYVYGWSKQTFVLFILLNFLATVNYTLFRHLRTKAKNILGSVKDKARITRADSKYNLFFKFLNFVVASIFDPVVHMSDHKNFLKVQSLGGVLALLLLVASNIWPLKFSPIVIILSILYTIYGLIIHPLKHRLYYQSKLLKKSVGSQVQELNWGKRMFGHFYLYAVPFLGIGLLLISYFTSISGNDLHTLEYVGEDKAELIDQNEFREMFKTSLEKSSDSNIYFIASYGGGLTANIWNNLILDSLDHYGPNGKTSILNNTISLSGVSGGGMGQGVYAAIQHNLRDRRAEVLPKIDSLRGNFLSLDLAWMFGKDLIRELIDFPFDKKVDRAKKSLEIYQDIIGEPKMSELSYRGYWSYISKNSYFPMLITNSAGTHNVQGLATSVYWNTTEFSKVFPGSVDILATDRPDSSLKYIQALSTCNRFPLVSPAAKIEGVGHFVDGGYFENSGMLSQYKLYQYLRSDTTWDSIFKDRTVVFVQIMNSTDDFLNDTISIKKRQENILEIDESGEFSAVISTGTEMQTLPYLVNRLVKNMVSDSVKYTHIALPYHISDEDILGFLNAKKYSQNLHSFRINHNHRIDDLRSDNRSLWTTSFPTTSRLVVPESFEYMQLVKRKGDIFRGLDEVIGRKE
ncbi:MAG: hypothetical protein COA58_15045 [Bacteroidetes bacterium]|nr:MAG: hypothetical protein COA58_15045 [Bacteroidota bacterium]